jgi:hypothetical protein
MIRARLRPMRSAKKPAAGDKSAIISAGAVSTSGTSTAEDGPGNSVAMLGRIGARSTEPRIGMQLPIRSSAACGKPAARFPLRIGGRRWSVCGASVLIVSSMGVLTQRCQEVPVI